MRNPVQSISHASAPQRAAADAIPRVEASSSFRSLWTDATPAGVAMPPLEASIKVDVLVVGAGYTGLSTALHLAETGCEVCVLDANEPGWGASGRNGGQVNPTLKHDPDRLVQMLGAEQANELIEAVSGSADLVFDLISRHRIDCTPVRNGWLQLAYSAKGVGKLHRRADQWAARGKPAVSIDASEARARTGSEVFAGGWLDRRAGSVNPLAYARGLARAAVGCGVRVHQQSAVVSLRRSKGQWVAATAAGTTVTAERVVLATNGYSGSLWPGLARTILAANSFVIATRPLTDQQLDGILPNSETLASSQRLMVYLRRIADGRLMIGGRGQFADPTSPEQFRHLERSLLHMYPQLGSIECEYRWGGRVAITRDFMPHVHEPAQGLVIALGYNGRGIAMATAMGKHLAARLTGSGARFPFPVSRIQPIPFHGMQRLYIEGAMAWFAMMDRLSA